MNNIETQKNYEECIKSFADKLDNKISFLERKISQVEQNSKATYLDQLEDLRRRKQLIQQDLKSIKKIAVSQWIENKDKLSQKTNQQIEEFEAVYNGIQEGFTYLFDK